VKLRFNISPDNRTARQAQAFTLAEALIASGIMVLLVTSVILCNLWGLSMSVREQIWLGSSDDAGQALGLMYRDIRSSVSNCVGSMGAGAFVPVGSNTNQVGNALMVYPSTNTSSWVLYYYNSVSNLLVRTNYSGTNSGDYSLVSANCLTNDNSIFTFTDYLGNIVTNPLATPVIQVYLSFTKLQNPEVMIAPGSSVDFYKVITTIASRNRP
jgi:hypothetical protein